MRLIGYVSKEKEAFVFYSLLLEKKVHATYEQVTLPETGKVAFAIWIYEEDEAELAKRFLEEYQKNPQDPRFSHVPFPLAPPQPPDHIAEVIPQRAKVLLDEAKLEKEKLVLLRKRRAHPLTFILIFVSVFLYIWNVAQQWQIDQDDGLLGLQLGRTKIQRVLMFDYPASSRAVDLLLEKYSLRGEKDLNTLPQTEKAEFAAAEALPTWRGVVVYFVNWTKGAPTPDADKGPFMEDIRKGEVYRLFTPALLHAGLLHILFNMAWAWILIKQIEERLPIWKGIILILAIGIVANCAQYLVSGPNFLGFSGVVTGLVGFIYVRQKIAPWEGYPLPRSIFLFLVIFVLAMFALDLVSLGVTLFTEKKLDANIANTAHLVGGFFGAFLALFPFFRRRSR